MAGKTYNIKAVIEGVDRLTAPVRRIAASVRTRLGGVLGHVGRLARGVTRALGSMLGPLGLLAGGGIVASLGAMVHGFARTGDEIGKFARQVGIGVEALQELQFAADRQGVPAADFRKSLVFLSKNLGEARLKTGSLYTVLKRLPRGFRDALLGAQSTGEAFDLAIGALGSIADASDRAALATALFGRSGAKMTRLAEAGAGGIAALREEARRLGLVISTDSATAAEEFTDRMTDLKAALSGLKMTIGSELVPVIRPMILQLTEWIRANRTLIGQKVRDVVKGIVDWLDKVDFTGIIGGIRDFFGWVSDLVGKLGGLQGILIGVAAVSFAPLLASLGPVGVVLAGILGIATALSAQLDHIRGTAARRGDVAGAKRKAFLSTGDRGVLASAGASEARKARELRVSGAVSGLVESGKPGLVVAGLLAQGFGQAGPLGAPTSARDVAAGNLTNIKEAVRQGVVEANAGPASPGFRQALALDVHVTDDRVTVTQRPPRGTRGPLLRGGR